MYWHFHIEKLKNKYHQHSTLLIFTWKVYFTNIFTKCREKNLNCGLGGAISANSADFIKSLVNKNLIDKYETRKIVYSKDAVYNISEGILAGVEFELLWLKSKRRYYQRIKSEDEKRIEMLTKRFNG